MKTGTRLANASPRRELVMEFRWIAILTLWTMLIGPMVDAPLGSPQARSQASRSSR